MWMSMSCCRTLYFTIRPFQTNPFLQDESNLADRIGAPISARLAQLQQSSSASSDSVPLVDNEEFLDSIIKNLEDVSDS